ncbi:MAG: elongation factor P maturation arginine rhamnosyltransferase EarP [Neisseria sp.]|nr:elongation factor P maturation arginine rhamnosyltransferase EarP [Neisseria sp.]
MPSALSPSAISNKVCWIFCTVIDNFGDIGVSWRLAKMLQQELGWQVCLWLDDENSLRALSPTLPALPCSHQNIALRTWQAGQTADLSDAPLPNIVIETFACDLPSAVRQVIRENHAICLNWEYLSAETWAEAMHGKPSLQSDGSEKYFWLMGFSERSGGLLRERNYAVPSEQVLQTFRRQLGLSAKQNQEWLLFGYQSEVWVKWLAMWQLAGEPLTLYLAGEPITRSIRTALPVDANALAHAGDSVQIGNISLCRLPFVPQDDFDCVLHLFDGLIIRGEDSFVRAQFSGKPFLWHIYPQDEMAHLDKLAAFWQKTEFCWQSEVFQAHQRLSGELNGEYELSMNERLNAWQILQQNREKWREASEKWQKYLFSQQSATEKLAKFMADLLK